jgi:hypothetical protein
MTNQNQQNKINSQIINLTYDLTLINLYPHQSLPSYSDFLKILADDVSFASTYPTNFDYNTLETYPIPTFSLILYYLLELLYTTNN